MNPEAFSDAADLLLVAALLGSLLGLGVVALIERLRRSRR